MAKDLIEYMYPSDARLEKDRSLSVDDLAFLETHSQKLIDLDNAFADLKDSQAFSKNLTPYQLRKLVFNREKTSALFEDEKVFKNLTDNIKNKTLSKDTFFRQIGKKELYSDQHQGHSKWAIIRGKLLPILRQKDSETGQMTVTVKLIGNESRLGEIFQGFKKKEGKPGKPAKKESVVMLDEDKRQNVLLHYDPSAQQLKDSNGQIVDTTKDESSRAGSPVLDHSASSSDSESSSKTSDNMFKYVISPSGELYVASKESFKEGSSNGFAPDKNMPVGSLSHAGFLRGTPVIAAGMIEITDGKITYIDNDSGHYKPDGLDIYNGISLLKKKMEGVFHSDCHVGEYEHNIKGSTPVVRSLTDLEEFYNQRPLQYIDNNSVTQGNVKNFTNFQLASNEKNEDRRKNIQRSVSETKQKALDQYATKLEEQKTLLNNLFAGRAKAQSR